MKLHITNGDSAANIMAEAGIPGHILPWRDILHDGPVPGGLSLHQLAEVRADFLHQASDAGRDEILQSFRERDQTLQAFRDFDTVAIWLEHDLYDQLQLLQLLHWFSDKDAGNTHLHLICIDNFEGIMPFYGLGQLNPQQMRSLLGSEQPISDEQIELGRRGWLAFTGDTPLPLLDFTRQDLTALPYMTAALVRHLEEFPDSVTGLSRHERQLLEMIDAGEQRPGRLFGDHQKLEAAPYLGDWSYWSLMEGLVNVPNALLKTENGADFVRPPDIENTETFLAQRLHLTEQGYTVLASKSDWLALQPPDFWKGGVHVHPDKTIWRWDAHNRTVLESRQ